MDFKNLKKNFRRGRKAVSPVVATLILIIVAIVGAVSVGLIVSGIGNSTSKGTGGAVSTISGDAYGASTLLIGGSTTLYPAVSAAAAVYGPANGITVTVQQGGSGAGTEGVAEGVLNIATVSAASSVSSAQSEYPTANLQAQEVGGSGVVFIANFGAEGTIAAQTNYVGITQAALDFIYLHGTAGILVADLSPATPSYLTSGDLESPPTVGDYVITAVSRADLPSGTEDTACSYLNGGGSVCASTSNNAAALPGVTEVGDGALTSYVETTAGTIGFTDIGYAEGANITPGSTTAAVQILEVSTPSAPGTPTQATTSGSFNSYALKGDTTGSIDNFIKASLNVAGGTVSQPVYPDSTSGTGLTRTFWVVTAGTPTPEEQAFITFLREPASTSFWNNAGYYSIYQLTPITPP